MTSANSPIVSRIASVSTPSSVSTLSPDQLKAHLARTRAELAATLDAVEEKVNVPKRLDRAAARARQKLSTMRQENPVALAAIAAGALGLVGAIVYAGFRSLTRR